MKYNVTREVGAQECLAIGLQVQVFAAPEREPESAHHPAAGAQAAQQVAGPGHPVRAHPEPQARGAVPAVRGAARRPARPPERAPVPAARWCLARVRHKSFGPPAMAIAFAGA